MNKYLRLMRLDKPIGIYLLLYPVLWSLLLAEANLKIFIIFICGVVLMRSSSCIINDFADRKIDKLVSRTKNRPLTTGEVHVKSALILFFALSLIAFLLVLLTNTLTIQLAFIAIVLATFYPFSKRFFVMPQLLLGLAFAMSVLMSFSASLGFIPFNALIVFMGTVIWTIIYDTMYAMSDREDDLKLGVKSSAILFGKFDLLIIAILQVILSLILVMIGVVFELGVFYFIAVIIAILLMIYYQFLIKTRDRDLCFKAFLQNNYLGFVILIGIVIDKLVIS